MIELAEGFSLPVKKTVEEKKAERVKKQVAWQKQNKETVNARNRKWRAAHSEQNNAAGKVYYARIGKARVMEREHGITKEQYTKQLEKQNYCCAICFRPLDLAKRTHQDHCHKTSKVRGILCHNCNLGIGHFKDSIVLLMQAIAYLKDWTV